MNDEEAELRNLVEIESAKERIAQENNLLNEIEDTIDERLEQIRKGDLDLAQGRAEILELLALWEGRVKRMLPRKRDESHPIKGRRRAGG